MKDLAQAPFPLKGGRAGDGGARDAGGYSAAGNPGAAPHSRPLPLEGGEAIRWRSGACYCGVKSFYRPRFNPDGWSVNARCLDDPDALAIRIEPFDGRNWEAHGASLAHLSHEAAQ